MTRVVALLWLLAAVATPAQAQTRTSRIEVHVGGGLLGGANLGAADADLRANDPGRRPFRLFTTDSDLGRAPAVHIRAMIPFGGTFAVEAGVTASRPDLLIRVSGDAEGAAPVVAAGRLDQYFMEAGLLVALNRLTMARVVPYLTGGGGYLRQLHEGRTVVEHGEVYYAGGGVRYPFAAPARGLVRVAGVRGEIRGYVVRGGVAVERSPRAQVAVSGGLFIGF